MTLLGVPALIASSAFSYAAEPDPIARYERASGGHIGIYAQNLASGAEFAWRAHDRFVMCSTVKASLVAMILAMADRGEANLNEIIPYKKSDIGQMYAPVAQANLAQGSLSVKEMCKAAVEVSDGACTNLLLNRFGGPHGVTSFWRSIGDDVTRLDHIEPFLNRTPPGSSLDTTTPAAMAANLRKFVLGDVLSKDARSQLTEWLIACQTGGNRLRAGLPANWVTGDKTGHSGKDAAGDIAISWVNPSTPIVAAVYTRGGAPTDEQFDAAFAGIGRLIANRLS